MNSKNINYDSPLYNNVLNKYTNQMKHINNLDQIRSRKNQYYLNDYDPYSYLQKGRFSTDLSNINIYLATKFLQQTDNEALFKSIQEIKNKPVSLTTNKELGTS
jgi:hypothetical protein